MLHSLSSSTALKIIMKQEIKEKVVLNFIIVEFVEISLDSAV